MQRTCIGQNQCTTHPPPPPLSRHVMPSFEYQWSLLTRRQGHFWLAYRINSAFYSWQRSNIKSFSEFFKYWKLHSIAFKRYFCILDENVTYRDWYKIPWWFKCVRTVRWSEWYRVRVLKVMELLFTKNKQTRYQPLMASIINTLSMHWQFSEI